jgi:iron(III) transport system ATP-binding protein
MSPLRVEGLWKGYGNRSVLEGVDLEVEPGSLTAVLGLSGCGKTTLLRVIAGFERAERGAVSLAARVLDDGRTYVAPERRGIGYVPQEGALFPHLTVRANVGFGLPRSRRGGAEVDELLEMVGIADLAGRMPHRLSGGEQQRVALARALARRPEVVLLDEPFSSLDAALRGRVREEVHALLRAQGVTTVLVTHDQEEALSLADTVAVLRDGKIVQSGSPADLYERPVDVRLARFLGAANLVPADFRDGTAVTALGALPLRGEAPAAATAGVVLVRPEQLRVSARSPGAGEEHPGAVSGHVEQCRYYGHDAVLEISTDREGLLGASAAEDRDSAELLLARVLGEHALAAGTPVTVAAHGPVSAVAEADADAAAEPVDTQDLEPDAAR